MVISFFRDVRLENLLALLSVAVPKGTRLAASRMMTIHGYSESSMLKILILMLVK